jgi:hypothetical protein
MMVRLGVMLFVFVSAFSFQPRSQFLRLSRMVVTISLSRVIKFTLVGFTTLSLFIHRSYILLPLRLLQLLFIVMSVFSCCSIGCVIVAFVGITRKSVTWRQKKKSKKINTNNPHGRNSYLWSELNDKQTVMDRVHNKRTASQFCSGPWISYILGRVLVCSQPTGVKPKIGKWCQLARGVKAIRRKRRDTCTYTYIAKDQHGYGQTMSTLTRSIVLFFCHGTTAPIGPGPPHYRAFTITLRQTTLGRTPLDEWWAPRRGVYLTSDNTHKRQTSMSPAGFEPTIPARERPQTHALDRAVGGMYSDILGKINNILFADECRTAEIKKRDCS